MSEAIKPTPGPWRIDTFLGCLTGPDSKVIGGHADLTLCAEAGTVFHETQCTPRQLVERVKELEDTSNLGLEPLVAPTPEVVRQALQSEDLSDYGAQLLEENGRKVLSYWPYCSKCRKPFEFEKDEPFASCGCPGSTEWGDPRPASWVQSPAPNARLARFLCYWL